MHQVHGARHQRETAPRLRPGHPLRLVQLSLQAKAFLFRPLVLGDVARRADRADRVPPGARALSGIYERYMEMCSFLEDQMQDQEPGSQAHGMLSEMADTLNEHTGKVAEGYGSIYPDLEPLYKDDMDEDDAE